MCIKVVGSLVLILSACIQLWLEIQLAILASEDPYQLIQNAIPAQHANPKNDFKMVYVHGKLIALTLTLQDYLHGFEERYNKSQDTLNGEPCHITVANEGVAAIRQRLSNRGACEDRNECWRGCDGDFDKPGLLQGRLLSPTLQIEDSGYQVQIPARLYYEFGPYMQAPLNVANGTGCEGIQVYDFEIERVDCSTGKTSPFDVTGILSKTRIRSYQVLTSMPVTIVGLQDPRLGVNEYIGIMPTIAWLNLPRKKYSVFMMRPNYHSAVDTYIEVYPPEQVPTPYQTLSFRGWGLRLIAFGLNFFAMFMLCSNQRRDKRKLTIFLLWSVFLVCIVSGGFRMLYVPFPNNFFLRLGAIPIGLLLCCVMALPYCYSSNNDTVPQEYEGVELTDTYEDVDQEEQPPYADNDID